MDSNERIFQILNSKDDITWQSLLYELVKKEGMNPWDVDISLLSNRYIDMVKKMTDLDLRVSGKMLLAAAILLKLKSNRLLNEDLTELDRLLSEPDEELADNLELEGQPTYSDGEKAVLIPRTPQPRKRKVSIYDLVQALEQALTVKHRRVLNSVPPTNVTIPKKRINIGQAIQQVYSKITSLFLKTQKDKVTFTQLLPSNNKEDKIFTFIPLLHLATQRKIDLEQQEHFGEIEIMLAPKKEIDKNK
jgi:segregation and condensation protein A